jgi:hypothetical protein
MKELKIIQGDDGTISIESVDGEGNPITTEAAGVDEALEQIKREIGGGDGGVGSEEEVGEEMEPIEPNEDGVVSASKGKKLIGNLKLEDGLPVTDKKKIGTRPRTKADWSDYSAI